MKRIFRNKKILKVIIILIVLSYFIYVLIKQQTTLNSYQTEQDYVSSQIQDQQEYKNEIADMEANINSDEYIEQIARDKLDMYLPNERVYVDANK
jgi:cell division protein ftsL